MTANGAVTKTARRDRFASGAAVRLELSDGDWVLVRAELSYGQQRRLAASGLSGVPQALMEQGAGGEALSVDLASYDLARLAVWVLDWSLVDGDGERVLVSREAIEALHPDTAAEINAALDAHIEALEAKKGPAGAGPSRPAATSSSASASAGPGRS
jgi:hypothetical protein